MRRNTIFSLLAVCCGIGTGALAADPAPHDHPEKAPTQGVAVLTALQNSGVQGTIFFNVRGDDLHVQGMVKGLTPGKHGFHIHEYGDLRDAKGATAGGHYNPQGHPHGGLHSTERHAGDLGNITADDNGVATVDLTIPGLKLHFILGRSIVVHAQPDDLTTQPSGDSGDRIGVGVIGIAQPPAAD